MKAGFITLWLRDVLPRVDGNKRVRLQFNKGTWFMYPETAEDCVEIQRYLPASYKQHELRLVWPQ